MCSELSMKLWRSQDRVWQMVGIHRLEDEKEKQRNVMKMGKITSWWEKGNWKHQTQM